MFRRHHLPQFFDLPLGGEARSGRHFWIGNLYKLSLIWPSDNAYRRTAKIVTHIDIIYKQFSGEVIASIKQQLDSEKLLAKKLCLPE